MSNCQLQEVLREDSEKWLDLLKRDPYNLIIKENDGFYLFKYHQIDSDFSEPIVREARGIILDSLDNWTICCRAFDKFFNYGEQYASKIDWKTAVVTEKLDGSLIKIWKYNDNIGISTNGTIDASEADLQLPYVNEAGFEISTYYDLVFDTLLRMDIEMYDVATELVEGETALFELCTPYNKIVVPHQDHKMYYLTSIMSDEGEEFYNVDVGDMFPKPKTFLLDRTDGVSLDEVVEMAEELPFDEEGYVVVDSNYNRIKVKSPAYLAIHHMKGEGVVSRKRMLDLIRANETDEFLNYFPEYTDIYAEILSLWNRLLGRLLDDLQVFCRDYMDKTDRKTLALWATKEALVPGMIFSIADRKYETLSEFLEDNSSEKILKWMEKLKK